jgi:WD40 repeat protein
MEDVAGVIERPIYHDEKPRAIDWSPNGTWLASGASSGSMIIWDTEAWKPIFRDSFPPGGYIYFNGTRHLKFSPDGSMLGAVLEDGTIRIWNTENWSILKEFHSMSDYNYGIEWSPDGSLIATAGDDRSLRLWDTSTWTIYREIDIANGLSTTYEFSPDGNYFAYFQVLTDLNRSLIVLDTTTWERIDFQFFSDHTPYTISWSADSSNLAAVVNDGSLVVWHIPSGSKVFNTTIKENYPYISVEEVLEFSPNGEYLSFGTDSGQINIWSTDKWDLIRTIDGHGDTLEHPTDVYEGSMIWSLRWTRDSKYIATIGSDHHIRIWEAGTWNELARLSEFIEGEGANLEIISFEFDDHRNPGNVDNSFFKIVYRNSGDKSTGSWSYKVIVNGKKVHEGRPDYWRLSPTETREQRILFPIDYLGEVEVELIVDSLDEVEESDENDNSAEVHLNVKQDDQLTNNVISFLLIMAMIAILGAATALFLIRRSQKNEKMGPPQENP